MKILFVAGFAAITKAPGASATLYREKLGLPLQAMGEYLFVDNFDGTRHFAVWPLQMAAQSCFGEESWPEDVPEPSATIEFELSDVDAVQEAVEELKGKGLTFVHEARLEPWGQTVARFISPEGLLIGLSYTPWMHGK